MNIRLCDAQHHYAYSGHKECAQGTDICHFSNKADGGKARNNGNENCTKDGNNIRSVIAVMNLADFCWNHAVTAHGKENTCLAVKKYQQHSGDTGDGANTNDGGANVVSNEAKGKCHWLRVVQLGIGNYAGENTSNNYVKHGADHKGSDNANRQVMGRVTALLCRGRNSVKADVGEENYCGTAGHAAEAEGHKGFPVGGFHMGDSKQKENSYRCKLYKYQNSV